MSLFLDSALPADAERAFRSHLVKGITTNPTLLAQTGLPAPDVIARLCDVTTGIVFHQLTSADCSSRKDEAIKMVELRPGRVGIKIPCTYENLEFTAELVGMGFVVGVTAIFSPPQVYLACQAGAHYIIPYVNRSTRLLGDGINLVHQMRSVIDADGAKTQILAASIKTASEAMSTLMAGAHHLTLPLALIESMGNHELSYRAIDDFDNPPSSQGSVHRTTGKG